VLASVLPADFDRQQFSNLLGFYRSAERVVQAAEILDRARITKRKVANPHGPRAFRITPPDEAIDSLHSTLVDTWGELPVVLDPMAGGGSIPLEALRLRLPVLANEYNPVASVILSATLQMAAKYGTRLLERTDYWKDKLLSRVIPQIRDCYNGNEMPDWCYLWARTVKPSDDEPPSPLAPNWWLIKKDDGKRGVVTEPYVIDAEKGLWSVRIKAVAPKGGDMTKPPAATITRGQGRSLFPPYRDIPGDRIKAEAQAGRMGEELYCVATKAPGLTFRPANDRDRAAFLRACDKLESVRAEWEREGFLPTENVLEGNETREPLNYGMDTWQKLFNPRQLYVLGVIVKELHDVRPEMEAREGVELAAAIETLLAFGVDKAANYNARMTRWHSGDSVVAGVFDRHDYSMKWSYCEMAMAVAGGGLQWCFNSVIEAYKGLCELMPVCDQAAGVHYGSATSLPQIADGSVHAVVVDPPYDDNVQYSELADFFYVWLKHSLGHRFPGMFDTALCDDSLEAVVDTAKFKENATKTTKAKDLARNNYRELMRRVFLEMHRVLRDDGCLTVMFTHKKQEAWGALFDALINVGFRISASWPVRTESEHSLHIARKNAAESTVMLVCRKREGNEEALWEDEVLPELRQKAMETASRLSDEGMNKVDQLVGAFGPAMSVFSRYARVDNRGNAVSSNEAIQAAADAVVAWRLQDLQNRSMTGAEHLDLEQIDTPSRFWLLWWDVISAHEARFNEAMLLGRSLGLGVDNLISAGLLSKKSEKVFILSAKERRADKPREEAIRSDVLFDIPGKKKTPPRKIHPRDPDYATLIDLLHGWALTYIEGGAGGIGAGMNFARRHQLQHGHPAVELALALLAVAPQGVWHGASETEPNAAHPEFFAWRELISQGLGIEVPEWIEEREVTNLELDFDSLPLGGLFAESEAEEETELETEEEAEDNE